MTYAAEPYAQFVDDLLTALTGGQVRERFVYSDAERPFRLGATAPVVAGSLRVFGLAGGAFARFVPGRDYELQAGPPAVVHFLHDPATGSPVGDANLPDPGTAFYVNYRQASPGGPAPLLTDLSPGSVVRTLAESFAREYAVLSRQLEHVYRAGFLDTATGRDLDQLVALVGLLRRNPNHAETTILFERTSPAPADIYIPTGTRVSTAEAPFATFETTRDATLRRGTLSVEVAASALAPGADSLVAPRTLTAIHQPILGVQSISNPLAARFASAPESDETLRARARRSLETAGKGTVGALLGALSSLPGLREKDILVQEDPFNHPGIVKITVAAELSDDVRRRAAELIDTVRPAGVRIEHNLSTPESLGAAPVSPAPSPPPSPLPSPALPASPEEMFYQVAVQATIYPLSLSLTAAERTALRDRAAATIASFIAEAGVGEILVHSRLIAALLQSGELGDVHVVWGTIAVPPTAGGSLSLGASNLAPTVKALRPRAQPENIIVEIGGALIAFDVTIRVTLKGAGVLESLSTAGAEIATRLQDGLSSGGLSLLSPAALKALVPPSEKYDVEAIEYDNLEFVEFGVRLASRNEEVELAGTERLWVRNYRVQQATGGAA